LGATEVFDVVYLGAFEIGIAHGVDDQTYTAFLNYCIVFCDFVVKRETVGKTIAAATGYEYPQTQGIVALLGHQALYFVGSCL
jgi:hypothetical protein